jgi:hypothetical protein
MEQEELSLIEIEQRHPDEWILVEEVAWNEQELPVRGRVLARSRERGPLLEWNRFFHQQHPGIKTFITVDIIGNKGSVQTEHMCYRFGLDTFA